MTKYRWNVYESRWEFLTPGDNEWWVLRESARDTSRPMSFSEGIVYIATRSEIWHNSPGQELVGWLPQALKNTPIEYHDVEHYKG